MSQGVLSQQKDLDHVVQSVRPVDDQPRNFQGGSKERGFFSNRLIMLLSSFCYVYLHTFVRQ
ncbi:unnamed protein product [Brassica rapa subsp. narinosa]